MVERRTPDAIQADNERRIASVVRLGVVEEADYDARRVRVRMGDLLTGWLPWTTERANQDQTWHPVEVGEQVILAAPNGDLAQGVVIGAVNSNANPGPNGADRPTVDRTTYRDGTTIEYDRTLRVLHIYAPNQVAIRAYGQITLVGDVVVDGNLQVMGTVRAERPIVSTQAVYPASPATVPFTPPSRRYGSIV